MHCGLVYSTISSVKCNVLFLDKGVNECFVYRADALLLKTGRRKRQKIRRGMHWGIRNGEQDMSETTQSSTGCLECRPDVIKLSFNYAEYHQPRNCNNTHTGANTRTKTRTNTRTNCKRSTPASPNKRCDIVGVTSNMTPVSTPRSGAFLSVEGITMKPPSMGVDTRLRSSRCRNEQRRPKIVLSPAVTIPATSRCLNIYTRSLSLTPDICSLMRGRRDALSRGGTTPPKLRPNRRKSVMWSPMPPPELTPHEWVRILQANPGDPILQPVQLNGDSRYSHTFRCRRRPLSAGVFGVGRSSGRQPNNNGNISEELHDLTLDDDYDIPSLTHCRRPQTAGPNAWRATDSVGITETMTPYYTPRRNRSTIRVTKSAFSSQLGTPRSARSTMRVSMSAFSPRMDAPTTSRSTTCVPEAAFSPRLDTPRSIRSTTNGNNSALAPRPETPRSIRSTTNGTKPTRPDTPRSSRSTISVTPICVTLPTTSDSCWASEAELRHHEEAKTLSQSECPSKTPYNSPKGSVVDLCCVDADDSTL